MNVIEPKELSTDAILAHTEDAALAIESLQNMLQRATIDSVQWFYISAFLTDLHKQIERMRRTIEKGRPSGQVRQLLLESYAELRLR